MKPLLCALGVLGLGALTAFSQTPEDDYVRIYNLIQQADVHRQASQTNAAAERYTDALRALQQFQAANPGWNEKVVKYRLNYISGHLAALVPPAPAAAGASGAGAHQLASQTAALVEAQRQTVAFSNELVRLQTDNATLNAKLREALAVQSPTVDPKEMARANERLTALQQENDLLRVTLEQEQAKAKALADPKQLAAAQQALTETQTRLAKQTTELAALRSENEVLKKQTPAPAGDAARWLAERDEQIAALKQTVAALTAEKESLARQLIAPAAIAPSSLEDGRRQELEKQLAEQTRQLQQARREADGFDKDNALLTTTVSTLSAQLKNATKDADAALLAELRQRNQLEAEVADLRNRLANTSPDRSTSEEVKTLRARIAVLEAPPVPYTAAELALFATPRVQPASLDPLPPGVGSPEGTNLTKEVQLASLDPLPPGALVAQAEPARPATGGTGPSLTSVTNAAPANTTATNAAVRKANRSIPPGTGTLVAEAQRAFSANDMKTAEQKYLEVLRQDERNSYILGNLAAVYVEMNKLDEAEKFTARALKEDPDSAMNQFVLGLLRYRQNRFDDAVDALSRSIQLDPEKPEAHLYLGTSFGQKGQRAAAEKELRKALQLAPTHPVAHYNLAVEYATQKPPALALARWHYQKAIANGHPHVAEFEKTIDWQRP